MNRSLLIESVDAEELAAAVAAIVIAKLGPVIRQGNQPPQRRCASREEMADILGWSITKLDRRTADGLPSFMDDGRRGYIVDEVLDYLKTNTPAAEAKARERQAAKTAAKNPAKPPRAKKTPTKR